MRRLAVDEYAEWLRAGWPFAQANYGDGEWACLIGKTGKNVNGEEYDPRLRDALRRTVLEPGGYLYGTNPGAKLIADVQPWMDRSTAEWVYKDTLSAANVNGELAPFLQAVRPRRKILVGPWHLLDLPLRVIGAHAFIEVPPRVAWQIADVTAARVRDGIKAGADLVLFCSGMASNLVIYDLWQTHGDSVTMIDLGACLDPYVNLLSRKGYRKQSFLDRDRERNLAPAP